ncbi:MAG: LacI family DNA-binding transcriptional regulator [Lachnospiraceae bacterium]|nr:LacI family DNA-binding transcriptional regulator [Lachnospiraceae bacterium]
MVRLVDVAKRCGVSVATVSKALSDKKDIGEETKEKIRKVCEEMGYFPNSSARTLKIKRSYNLGVLFVAEDDSGLTHDYFSHVLESFRMEAEASGYDITFIYSGQSPDGESLNAPVALRSMSYLERAEYRGVDGVLVACANYYQPEVMELISSNLPVVTIDHSFDHCSSVVSDNVRGMSDLIEFIYDRGHRKIAFIYGNNTSVTQNRIASYYRSLEERGIDPPDQYVRSAVYRNPKPSYDITLELLDLKNSPTCIIYPDDYACIGGLNAIKERGYRIPEDISVAGYDGVYISQILEPRLTTLRQNTEEIGRKAARKLISQVENPKTAIIEKIIVPGRLLEGGSVGILRS